MNQEQRAEALNNLRLAALLKPCMRVSHIVDPIHSLPLLPYVLYLGIYRRKDVLNAVLSWHASVCLPATIGVKATSRLTARQKKSMLDLAVSVLDPVGEDAMIMTRSDKGLHLSRLLSDEEKAVLVKNLPPLTVFPCL